MLKQTILTPALPFVASLWLSDEALVVAGHDMKPGLVSRSDGSW